MLKTMTPCLIVTFYTTAAAIATEKLCMARGISGRLIPVPRSITASCGLAWRTQLENRALLEEAATQSGVEIAGWYESND